MQKSSYEIRQKRKERRKNCQKSFEKLITKADLLLDAVGLI
jgi:hypothetical protein